jgi:hypothetical protein
MLSVPKHELDGQFAMLPMGDIYFGPGNEEKLGVALAQYGIERAGITASNPRKVESRDRLIGPLKPHGKCG